MRNFVKLPTIQNVAAGNSCILQCPLGPTYDQIIFTTNLDPDEILNFKIKLGSRTIVDVPSFQVIKDINDYYGRPETSGFLTYWFMRPELRDEIRALTSMGTLDVQSLNFEFDIDAGAVSPVITAHAVQRAPTKSGLFTKIHNYPRTFSVGGEQEIDNLPRGGARISAIHLGKADISNVIFEVNNGGGPSTLIQGSKAILESLQVQNGRTPITASYTHIDFNLLGELAGPMPTHGLQDMRVKPTLDTSGAVSAVVEYMDGQAGV